MQHVSETAKIFKYKSVCVFHRTQLMAMHNTIMTSNTNGVPPSQTHMQNYFSLGLPYVLIFLDMSSFEGLNYRPGGIYKIKANVRKLGVFSFYSSS
jgi:hypothetical protein